jgi:hypothetical protein
MLTHSIILSNLLIIIQTLSHGIPCKLISLSSKMASDIVESAPSAALPDASI